MRTSAVVAMVLSLVAAVEAQSPTRNARQQWNETFSEYDSLGLFERYSPNQFLKTILESRTPGTSLDIAMGQGRNALLMASYGWEVAGFDISDVAIDLARSNATERGLHVDAVVADAMEFDYGTERWDLVSAIYVHDLLTARADDVKRSLRPGGILVVEGFHRDEVGFGYRTNELLDTFGTLAVLHYEEAVGIPDQIWGAPGEAFRFVRLVAEKR